MKRWLRFVPLAAVGLLVVALDWRLSHPPSNIIVSRLVGEPFPDLPLAPAIPDRPGLDGPTPPGPRLVNLFASWCLPCIGEAPVLAQLQREGVAIDGIAVRDKPERLTAFLTENGNPYRRIGTDPDSRGQLALGSSGVPETFVVDSRGIVGSHRVGPIEERDLDDLRAELRQAR